MTVNECYQYVQARLNKLGTNANKNIPIWAFVSSFNAQQLLWVEDRIKADETNTLRKDEINQLLKTTSKPLIGTQTGSNYYEFKLPEDYFHYKRSTSLVPCEIRNFLKKEGDINTLLLDNHWKPSIEWGETLCTLVGKHLRVYVDGFSINGVNLTYYRFPQDIGMSWGSNDVNGNPTVDIDPEFTGSSLIEILNMTCELLSSDTVDQWNLQTSMNRGQKHN